MAQAAWCDCNRGEKQNSFFQQGHLPKMPVAMFLPCERIVIRGAIMKKILEIAGYRDGDRHISANQVIRRVTES
jgi:hypothetical protein